jgi:hypothetical protein
LKQETIGAGTEFEGIRKSFIPHKILITDTVPGDHASLSVPACKFKKISFGL